MDLLIIFLACIGACIGSFVGVIATGDTGWISRRSQCQSCQKNLRWYELIPLISYIVQRGKCRRCHASIPQWIFWIEVGFLMLWGGLGSIWRDLSLTQTILMLIVISWFALAALEDLMTGMIDDKKILPLILIVLILAIIRAASLPMLTEAIIGAVIGYLFYAIQMVLPAILQSLRDKHRVQNTISNINYLEEQKQVFRGQTVGAGGIQIERGGQSLASFCPLNRFGTFSTKSTKGIVGGGNGMTRIFGHLSVIILYPVWMMLALILGEKRANTMIPSVPLIEKRSLWVGIGDLRLGVLVGLLVGPFGFFWIVMVGYIGGTLWAGGAHLFGQKLRSLPVAPLLFVGYVGWLIFWL